MFNELTKNECLSVNGGDHEQDYYDMGYEIGNATKHVWNVVKYATTPYWMYRSAVNSYDSIKKIKKMLD